MNSANGDAGEIIDVDMGNTRIKWRVRANQVTQESGAFSHDDLRRFLQNETTQNSCDELFKADRSVQRIRVANVAGEAISQLFREACQQAWQVNIEVARVVENCAGVTQGYTDKSRLGVDRWLAILAAYNESHQACVVISCGTAITVDLITATGQHLGGYIVPGFEMMRKALFAGTHAVKVETLNSGAEIQPGRATDAAVENGLFLMVQGLVEKATQQLTATDPQFVIVVGGGDGERLLPYLGDRCRYNGQLVLDGLAYALP